MFWKNIVCLAIAREHHRAVTRSYTAKRAIFLPNIFWESCGKFYLKKYPLENFSKYQYFTVFPWQPTPIVNKHQQKRVASSEKKTM